MASDPFGDDVDASVLIIILETNPSYWESPTGRSAGSAAASGLDATLRQLLIFVNAYLSLHQQNRVAVIAMHSDGCHHLYASPFEEEHEGAAAVDGTREFTNNAGGLEPIQADACACIVERLSKLARGRADEDTESGDEDDAGATRGAVTAPLAAALSMAMCYCNRLQTRGIASAGASRIVCLQGSEDDSSQYIAMMNGIFSAQRAGIPIDSCVLGDDDSAFLQQAANISGGLYYKPRRGEALVQYLLSLSSADQHSRKFLRLPSQRGIDFRASCFCHKQPVDAGFVCSVCLSIFCQDLACCPTCGADFVESRLVA